MHEVQHFLRYVVRMCCVYVNYNANDFYHRLKDCMSIEDLTILYFTKKYQIYQILPRVKVVKNETLQPFPTVHSCWFLHMINLFVASIQN